jgi:hypothetical protein
MIYYYFCGSAALYWALTAFSVSLILYIVSWGLFTRGPPIARLLPTYRATQTGNKHTHTSIPSVGFELMTPGFEGGRTIRAFDRASYCDQLADWVANLPRRGSDLENTYNAVRFKLQI